MTTAPTAAFTPPPSSVPGVTIGSVLDGGIPEGDPTTAWTRRRDSYKLVSPLNAKKFTVVVVGTGGLSHQLDGERAGFINKQFDQQFMQSLASDPQWVTQYTIPELVERVGTQGIELLMWLTARATLGGSARELHSSYHIPISNTAAGVMLFEPAAQQVVQEEALAA